MNFSEINPRTKIVLVVTNGSDMQARFLSKVMKNNGNFLLAIPFKHKGLRINFEGKDIRIVMEVRDQAGALWSFRGIHINTVKKDGLVYHRITSSMTNGIENRRGGRRFYVWEPAIFHIEGVENTVFTNMKDVGPVGFSFAIDNKKNLSLKEGAEVRGTMKNNTGDEIELKGIIVRKESMEKYTLYGCKMDEPSDAVLRYVKYLEKKSVIVDVDF